MDTIVIGLLLFISLFLQTVCFVDRPSSLIRKWHSSYDSLTLLYGSNLQEIEETQQKLLEEYEGHVIR